MSYAFYGGRPCRGGMAVGPLVVVLFLGLVLGYLSSVLLRLSNLDPLQRWTRPPVEAAPKSEVAPPPAFPIAPVNEMKLRSYIVDVQKQRVALDEREKNLAAQAELLEQERAKLEAMKKEMDEVQDRVKKSAQEISESEEDNIKRLGKVWGQMEPAEVAATIKGLDPEFSAKVLVSMTQERLVAPILGAVSSLPNTERLASDLVEKMKTIKRKKKPVKKEFE